MTYNVSSPYYFNPSENTSIPIVSEKFAGEAYCNGSAQVTRITISKYDSGSQLET